MFGLSPAQAFAIKSGLGLLAGLLIIGWQGWRLSPARTSAWLDVGLGAWLGGVLGGRVIHVLYNTDYFRAFPGEVVRVWHGGLDWHGAVLGGLLAAWGLARWRDVDFRAWSDAAALAAPLGMMGLWWACRSAGCAYHHPSTEIAALPDALTGYLPNAAGDVALRLELQLFGVSAGLVIFIVAAALTMARWLPGLRLWVVLALMGAAHAGLTWLRNIPGGSQTTQMLDLTVAVGAALVGLWLWRRPVLNLERVSQEESSEA